MAVLRGIMKLLLAIVILIVGFIAVGSGLNWYYWSPLAEFCASIPSDMGPQPIRAAAEKRGFLVFEFQNDSNKLSIINHRPFFFRYECRVEFVDGEQNFRELFTAD